MSDMKGDTHDIPAGYVERITRWTFDEVVEQADGKCVLVTSCYQTFLDWSDGKVLNGPARSLSIITENKGKVRVQDVTGWQVRWLLCGNMVSQKPVMVKIQ